MSLNIVLYKLTDQGIKDIKGAPKRIEEGIKALETNLQTIYKNRQVDQYACLSFKSQNLDL